MNKLSGGNNCGEEGGGGLRSDKEKTKDLSSAFISHFRFSFFSAGELVHRLGCLHNAFEVRT